MKAKVVKFRAQNSLSCKLYFEEGNISVFEYEKTKNSKNLRY